MGRWIWGLAGLVLSSSVLASAYNMPVGVTEVSREVHGLHMLIFGVCCVIGVVVFGAMIYSIIYHRKSVHPKPADFHESIKVEIAWTVLPFIILIAMAIPAAGTLIKMETPATDAEITIKITGYQWKWHYEYMNEGVSFYSKLDQKSDQARQLNSGINPAEVPNYLLEVDEPLVLPVGKKIRFLLTSNDVIHSWWVPAFANKKDAVPGYINEMWTNIDEPGIYRGQCTELCGRDHGFMPVVVRAVQPDVYAQWLAERGGNVPAAIAKPVEVASAKSAPAEAPAAEAASAELSKDTLMQEGEKVYKNYCAACHQPDGSGMAAANFPALTGSAVANGPVETHIERVLKGRNAMASFAYLKDREIAAVVTYERNALGNAAGDVVQPAQVAAQR